MAARVLIVQDLLQHICDYHADLEISIKHGRNRLLSQVVHRVDVETLLCTIYAAAKSGNLEALKIISARDNINMIESICDWNKVVNKATKKGHIHILQWLHGFGQDSISPYVTNVLDIASGIGNMLIINWLCDTFPFAHFTATSKAVDLAAARGHLEVIKWLHNRGIAIYTMDAVDYAASHGHLHVLKWLHANYNGEYSNGVADYAAGSGSFETLEWLAKNGIGVFSSNTIIRAAAKGHLSIVKWLYFRKIHIGNPAYIIDSAFGDGHMDVVNWVMEKAGIRCYQPSDTAICEAARNGHLNAIKWIHPKKGRKCSHPVTNAIVDAASMGRLDVIQWLFANCPDGCARRPHEAVMRRAVRNGHLHVIEWLYTNYVRFGQRVISDAVYSGKISVVKWILQNHQNIPEEEVDQAIELAAEHGSMEILKYLITDKHLMNTNLCEVFIRAAYANGNLNVIRWLARKTGISVKDLFSDSKYINSSYIDGNFHIISSPDIHNQDEVIYNCWNDTVFHMILYHSKHIAYWLLRNGYQLASNCISSIIRVAASDYRLGVLEWLRIHMPDAFKQNVPIMVYEAIRHGQLNLLRWLDSLGYKNNILQQQTL